MAKSRIRISTVIPVYNAEKYLTRCLDSVLHQGLQNCEVICVDDGSCDGSLEILKEYAQRFSNFYFFHQENKHAGVARNVGVQYAKGEFIHFLDADDYLYPEFYQRLDQILDRETVDYIRFRNQAFDMQTNKPIANNIYSMDDLLPDLWGKYITFEEMPDIFMKISPGPWNGIVSREFILKHNILFNDLICCNDRSFYVQVIYFARSIYLCDLFGVHHQVNNKESLIGIRKFHFDCHFQSFSLIESLLREAKPYIRQKIMGEELRDLLWWYKALDSDEYSRWKAKVYEFLQGIDVLELDSDIVSNPLLGEILDEFGLNPLDELEMIHTESDLYRLSGDDHEIAIYGAGRVAEAFLKENERVGYLRNISKIYVTALNEGMKYFNGIPVVTLRDIDKGKNVWVILAVTRQYQLPIYHNLHIKGYSHITLFSEDFCRKLLEIG